MSREKIIEYLDKLAENKQIEKWGFAEYGYWENSPYAIINGNRLFLCETLLWGTNKIVRTIFDLESEKKVEKYIQFILDNQKALDEFYIDDINGLKAATGTYKI